MLQSVQERPLIALGKLDPVEELERIEMEFRKRLWRLEPDTWVEQRLKEFVWSKQREILRALQKYRKVLVKSCHGIGKSWSASRAAGWWLDVWPAGEAFVVTSAPSGPQIKAILWREIGRVHGKGLRGRVNQSEWYMPVPSGKEELVAFGRKPDDYDPAAFQGIHARRVLVILDEANGIRGALHEAAESLTSNDYSKMLMIGNPDDPSGEYYEASKPGSGWHVIQIGAFDTPNFTGEEIPEGLKHDLIGHLYVEDKRKKQAPSWTWNEEHTKVLPPADLRPEDVNPFWASKVLGEFPAIADENGLIPLHWILAAQKRELKPGEPHKLSLDVGAGGDDSVCGERRGDVFRVLWDSSNPDTMKTCNRLVDSLDDTNAESANVDEIGIGKGVLDRGKELKKTFFGISTGEHADDPKKFMNRRAELWWMVRTKFERGTIDIDQYDDDLAAELLSIRFERLGGKIQIESKKHAKTRGVPSPNRAESLMLAYAEPRKKFTKATWGR